MLDVLICTNHIIFVEAVFGLQADLDLTNNVEVVVVFVEQENVEIEITIVRSKTDLDNIGSAYRVLLLFCCLAFENEWTRKSL